MPKHIPNRIAGLEFINTLPVNFSRKHVRVQPPSHQGPPSDTLVITTKIPPITIRFQGRVQAYSRHQIAKDLHMHPSTVSMLFSGKRNLTLNMALKFRNYFKVSLDYIVDELMPQSIYLIRHATNTQRAEILAERANEQSGDK